jgi:hypothetical protein
MKGFAAASEKPVINQGFKFEFSNKVEKVLENN